VDREIPDKPGVAAPPPLIYAGGFALGYLIENFLPTALFSESMSEFVGWSLIAFGVLVAVFALSAFRRARTPVNPYAQATTLVTGGPFRFSRNPLYLALTVIYLGAAGLLNSLWPVLLLPAVLWFMHWGVIIREERYLERKFGPAYQEYKARVRRWL